MQLWIPALQGRQCYKHKRYRRQTFRRRHRRKYRYASYQSVAIPNGFRYGLELQPIDNLHIGIFYDDGGEKFGGDIAYVYNIAAPAKRESKVAFSPDLFSPVLREYSQRIITATTGPQIEVLRTPTLTTFMVSVVAAMTIRTTTEMLTVQQANNIARAASVHFTARIDNPASFAGYVIATTQVKFLITLPPASQITRPLMLTISRTWIGAQQIPLFRVIMNFGSPINVGVEGNLVSNAPRMLTLTIREGSEEYTTPAGLITSTLTTRTTTTTEPITTTMAMTAFLTTTITLGLTTNAEANVNSHLPPSFPLSFPQVPKLALAAPVILARRARE